MRVLQINSVCGYGSTGRIVAEISQSLEAAGDEALTIYGRNKSYAQGNAVQVGSTLSVKLHVALNRITDRHGFYSKKATRELIALAEKYNPDVIQLHNIHGYYLNMPLLFQWLAKAGRPVVWTLHDCWTFTGHCSHFDYIGCQKWKTGCTDCPQKHTYPTSLIMDASAHNYGDKRTMFTAIPNMTLVTPSQWLATMVRQSYMQKYPIQVVPNGIDLTVFSPQESGLRTTLHAQGKTILLGVANIWEERKGTDVFRRLARELDHSHCIVMVGVDEKLELPPNIIRIKRTANLKELAQLYTVADVYLNPSYEETMGMTTVEALACGTPVIAFNATAVPEAIDSSCGIVVQSGDYAAFRAAIQTRAYEKFSQAACLRQAKKYNKGSMHQKYLALYRSLCAEV